MKSIKLVAVDASPSKTVSLADQMARATALLERAAEHDLTARRALRAMLQQAPGRREIPDRDALVRVRDKIAARNLSFDRAASFVCNEMYPGVTDRRRRSTVERWRRKFPRFIHSMDAWKTNRR